MNAQKIVNMLLEAGGADQDYDHAMWDAVVKGLEEAGVPGATHREFDKYQGVCLRVPNVGNFCTECIEHVSTGDYIYLYLRDELQRAEGEEVDTIQVDIEIEGNSYKADVENLAGYCKKVISAKETQQACNDVIDQTLSDTGNPRQ